MQRDKDQDPSGDFAGDEATRPDAPRAASAGDGNPDEAPPAPADPVTALTEEKKALHDRLLRVAADFENYKKRSKREIEDAQHRAREQILKELLPVADNLERALVHVGADPQAIVDGVRMVLRQLETTLERLDVRPVAAAGRPFDPSQHEAIQQVESTEHAPGTVVAELQRGYTLGQRLLRPALVTVAKAGPEKAAGAPPDTAGAVGDDTGDGVDRGAARPDGAGEEQGPGDGK